MVSVELKTVSKSWGGAAAVDAISFTVEGGKLVALLGPSGCGKSTTLRLIAGLEDTSGGMISIGGRDVTHAPPSRRGIAMVFQNYALFPHLSVAENILFGLKVRKVSRAERDERLARAASILGLSALLERKPSQLSGGQQQRVALGRAIVAEAPVCLMDEPLSNLDAQLRVEMRREIRELQQRLGMTMVYVTHDQVEAMTMADQVVLMRNGKIEQDAAPDMLYENPETIFAARFVGTPPMNVLPLAAVQARGGTLPPPPGLDPAGLAVGIRPEQVEIDDSGVAADVVAVEYLGSDTLIETRVDGHSFIVKRPGKVRVTAGEQIYIALSQSALHWFDLASERKVVRN
ncbi:ABC transporter ATP-binding protein [Bosea sp. F3-2]|uniref:ABC transporter ATP-binding protein n=1 Tax=Bosea sp. F3-2 TaxID=2599640 RepID=UPI0011EF25D9|nr:ABC transporter ATP-binding protein [Bosea sp. F3-2]QEL22228.1 ABC transporter ATP-binding protein [Bosea sp. F3-2]